MTELTRLNDPHCPVCGGLWQFSGLHYWVYGHYCPTVKVYIYWTKTEYATDLRHLELKRRKKWD